MTAGKAIDTLLIRHGATGYYYKDHSDLIGFHSGGGIAWYRLTSGDPIAVRVAKGTPEVEFSRLHGARFSKFST